MLTGNDEKISREAEWHIRWDGLIEAIVGTALSIGFSIAFGYFSWVHYLNFYGSFQHSIWDWNEFNSMVIEIFLSGFWAAISFATIQTLLRKEIKKELQRRKEEKPQ